MKERPILFSGEMVRAILEGRKTQTRRIVNRPLKDPNFGCEIAPNELSENDIKTLCPHGSIGDQLWVRETFCQPSMRGHLKNKSLRSKCNDVEYAADMGIERFPLGGNFTPRLQDFKWRPSIFMPRWASRITLEITNVRVERLQEITEEDAIAEGCLQKPGITPSGTIGLGSAKYWYMQLWDSINSKRGFGWKENPWCWVIEFKRITK